MIMGGTVITQPRGSSSGGYRGDWVAGVYPAGSSVRRGIGTWATSVETSQDPCTPEGNMGSASDWILRGDGPSQSGTILTVLGSTDKEAAVFGTRAYSGWANRRLIVDAFATGGEHFAFGIYDAAASTAVASTFGVIGRTGVYAFNLDVRTHSTFVLQNGVQGSSTSVPSTIIGGGNDTLTGRAFYRWFMDLEESGANMVMTVRREKFSLYLGGAVDGNSPGLVAQYTFAKPSFTNWRFLLGGVSFATAGLIKVSNAWTSRIPSANDWRLVSQIPHTPSVEHTSF